MAAKADSGIKEPARTKEVLKVGLYNLGTVNKNRVTLCRGIKCVNLYFSYQTLVAVDNVVSENIWSRTTGKLLNELEPDKSQRVPVEQVEAEAQKRINKLVDEE